MKRDEHIWRKGCCFYGEKEIIKCRLKPSNIYWLNRIFEGYDGLGLSTLDNKAGLVVVYVTPTPMMTP